MKAFLWKYLPIPAIVLVLMAIVGMSQYAESSKKRYDESATHFHATALNKDETGNANNDAHQAYEPPIWAKYVTFPEGVGAWAVILTLIAIVWQSIETRSAAQASLKQAKLLRKQTKIQEAGMRQWIDVEARSADVSDHYRSGKGNVYVVHLQFEAINNTPYVLTIQKIRTCVGMEADSWEVFTVETNIDLSPESGANNLYPFFVPCESIKQEWFAKGTIVTLNGEITFLDCMGKSRVGYFGGLYQCSPAGFYREGVSGIVPDRKKIYARNPSEVH